MTIDYPTLLNWNVPEARQQLQPRDCMLYALGVGLGADPLDRTELDYVYEQDLRVLPTMATVMAYPGFWMKSEPTGLDWKRLVHASQRIILHAPLPTTGALLGRTRVTAIIDKGPEKGALVYQERVVTDEATGVKLCTLLITSMCRGDGGVTGMPAVVPPAPAEPDASIPDRPADLRCDLKILPQAALIYRLSGDFNPLHADPDVAAAAGFRQPILHGLCTFGMAGHALLKMVGWPEGLDIVDIGARFSSPVYPGETLQTEIWRLAPDRVAFRCRVTQRDLVVLNNGFAVLQAATPSMESRHGA